VVHHTALASGDEAELGGDREEEDDEDRAALLCTSSGEAAHRAKETSCLQLIQLESSAALILLQQKRYAARLDLPFKVAAKAEQRAFLVNGPVRLKLHQKLTYTTSQSQSNQSRTSSCRLGPGLPGRTSRPH
jgi:hypothetical protein